MPKKDLRQIKKSRMSKEDIKKAAKKAGVSASADAVSNNDIQNVEDTIHKYENKSEAELMTDLESMVAQGKKNGTFSNEMMDAFIKNVSPMMDKAQRDKLKNIARMMKD